MKRINTVLGVLLVAQVGVFGLLYAFCGGQTQTMAARRLLLKGLERSQIAKITITDNDGKQVKLEKRDGKWVLPERADHPADEKKVERVLGQLLGLESVYIVSRSTTHHHEFEVAADKFRRRVTLSGEQGQERQLLVGKTSSSGFSNVRLASGPEVYAVEDLKYWELGTRIADWAARQIVDEDSKRVARLEIAKEGKKYLLERDNLEQWRLGDKAVKKTEADSLASKASKVELSDIVGKRDSEEAKKALAEAGQPLVVTVALAADPLPSKDAQQSVPEKADEQQEGAESSEEGEQKPPAAPSINQTIVLRLWKKPDNDNQYYLVRDDGDYLYLVDKWRVSKFVDFDPDKIIDKSQSSVPEKSPRPGKQVVKKP